MQESDLIEKSLLCAMLNEAEQTFANSTRKLIPESFVVRRGRKVLFRQDGLMAVITHNRLQRDRSHEDQFTHDLAHNAGAALAKAGAA